jgi:transcriptional regulator with XRE-family HTH domain
VGVSDADEFAALRRETDPIRRGRRATELLTVYQQRSTELARLRRAAIEEARADRDMNYAQIAAALGITKGRITQIRASAPPAERALFGVGPVTIGVPWRYQVTDRERPLIAAEDAKAGEQAARLVEALGFATTPIHIEPDTDRLPDGDALLICGPKSAPVVAHLLDADPALSFIESGRRWVIEHRATGNEYASPSDGQNPENADLAYIGRHVDGDRVVLHIAGLHAIGSLGAIHYLANHAASLYAEVGEHPFSMVVRAEYDGLTIVDSEVISGPHLW